MPSLLSANDDLAVVAGAWATHFPLLSGTELPSYGETLRGCDLVAFGFAIDILTNLFLLAALE